ncbi:MAG: hypothetical protein ACNA71_02125 [Kiritimatiellia bacterium]
MRKVVVGVWVVLLLVMVSGSVQAQRRGHQQPPPVPLTETGEQLLVKYTEMLQALQAEVIEAVPALDEALLADLRSADEAVQQAQAAEKSSSEPLNAIRKAEGLVGHAKNKWIGGANKGIAQAEKDLKSAKTDAERKAAEEALAKWQQTKADGEQALRERQAVLDQARENEAAHREAHNAATQALSKASDAQRSAQQALVRTIVPFLSSDKLDHTLMQVAVLGGQGPRDLAHFAQQGKEQEAYVASLLKDRDLLHAMLTQGGADGGKYVQARQILDQIMAVCAEASNGTLSRLALGVSLEYANSPDKDALKRYRAYEQAFLTGELDPAFQSLTAWDMRMVVNGDEPEEIAAWGRAMLRNYRPDHVMNPGHGWRYSGIVRTDVKYGSQNVKYDRPELHRYQNIIMNGGICGRRAFFGRFILRSFGVPTIARPSPGHAALARWTPDGWVVNLGGGWGVGRINGRPDTVFLQTTRIRRLGPAYMEVLRAEWIATAYSQAPINDKAQGELWNNVADFRAKLAIADAKPAELAALGEDIGEANEAEEVRAAAVAAATVTDADRQIVIGSDGVITIPAGAFSGAQLVMSFLGGQQMIHSTDISCEVTVPQAGRYALTARIVTVGQEQSIGVKANDKDAANIAIPYTTGMWATTAPVVISLVQGKNKLIFSKPDRSFAIKDFTLTPVR